MRRVSKKQQAEMDTLNLPLLERHASEHTREDPVQDAIPVASSSAARSPPPPPPPPPAGALHRAWQALLSAWYRLLRCLKQCISGRQKPQLSLLQEARLEVLRERIAAGYNPGSPDHHAALQRLWSVAFPDQPFPVGVRSAAWKQMGWQQDDPGTDFRGGGALSLELLTYLAEHHQSTFLRLMRKETGRRAEHEYPFAAAGVNLTFMLVDALDLRDGSRPPLSPPGRSFLLLLGEVEDALERIFVESFILLDAEWLRQRASYFDFPAVLRAVRRRVEIALSSGRLRSGEDLPPLLHSRA